MSPAVRAEAEAQPTTSARRWRGVAGGLALLFGAATVIQGGLTLLGRGETGNVVPFVLAFHFVAGFAYLAAGGATLAGRRWAVWIARALAVSTALVFVALGAHVLHGGAYEVRTVVAMTLRTTFWVVQSLALPGLLRRSAA